MFGSCVIHDFIVTGIGHMITFNETFFRQIFDLNIYELSFYNFEGTPNWYRIFWN